jgi:hypothetical protein
MLKANSAIFQLYHDENHCNDDETRFVLDQHPKLDFYSFASSLKQQSGD